jgi:hypothetical protein
MIRAAILAALLAGPAAAHSFYSAYCCSDQDCVPIPASAVEVIPTGWRVTLHPGQHPFVTETVVQEFTHPGTGGNEAFLSEDEDYHACKLAFSSRIRCFYAPLGGA